MAVIIDTSVWIPALELGNSPERVEVARLVRNNEAAIVGTVLLEVLRGARSVADFERLSNDLDGADFIQDTKESWLQACRIRLEMKLSGQTIPAQDAVIAAQALVGGHAIYTHDEHFQRIRDVRLHTPESA